MNSAESFQRISLWGQAQRWKLLAWEGNLAGSRASENRRAERGGNERAITASANVACEDWHHARPTCNFPPRGKGALAGRSLASCPWGRYNGGGLWSLSSVPGQPILPLHPVFRDVIESSELGLLWGLTMRNLMWRPSEAAGEGAKGPTGSLAGPRGGTHMSKARSPCLSGEGGDRRAISHYGSLQTSHLASPNRLRHLPIAKMLL